MTTAMERPFFSSGEESYMDDNQLMYFKNKLIRQKMETVEKMTIQKKKMKAHKTNHADVLDRSNSMMEIERIFQSQKRHAQHIKQIDAALKRIADGSYGYCILTGNPIGLGRLEAIPFTSISIKALMQTDIRA